jgi:hypothetical protein
VSSDSFARSGLASAPTAGFVSENTKRRVPEGRPITAHRFSGGTAAAGQIRAVGTIEIHAAWWRTRRPYGTWSSYLAHTQR